jgi:hypothetical protein
MGETTSSFLFLNIKIWGRIDCGMVKITQMTRIADLITPFNSLHKVFEILLLVRSLGTTWWRFMPLMVPLRPETFQGRERFPWTSSRAASMRNRPDSFWVTWRVHFYPKGTLIVWDIFTCHLPLQFYHAHSVVSKVIRGSNSFVYSAISFSPRVFLWTSSI